MERAYLYLLLVYFGFVNSLGEYRERLPNGFNCPCPPGECVGICAGIGHVNNDGSAGCAGGEHPFHTNNAFGLDLEFLGNFNWTEAVCKFDSDNDGLSNGDELGDPFCTWRQGTTPTRTARGQISHPGAATSKVTFKSCVFEQPNIIIVDMNTTQSAINLQISTNNTCICSRAYEMRTSENSSYASFPIITNGNVYSLTSLNENSTYFIRFTFGNLKGNSTLEIEISTLPISPSAPQPPSTIDLLFSTANSIAISWTQVSGVSGYELDMAKSDEDFFTAYRGPDGSYQANNLETFQSYKFRVRSYNSFGLGQLSDTFNFTTGGGISTTGTFNGGNYRHFNIQSRRWF